MPRTYVPVRFTLAAVVAFVVNGVAVAGFVLLARTGDATSSPAAVSSEVTLLRVAAEEPEEPEPAREPETFLPDQAPVDNALAPDTDVVSAANRVVDRETRARDPRRSEAEAVVADASPPPVPQPARQGEPLDVPEARLAPDRADPEPAPAVEPAEDGPQRLGAEPESPGDTTGPGLPARPLGVPEAARPDGAVGGVDLRAFAADSATAQQFVASSTVVPPDHITLEEADRTAIASRRVAYWSFFERLTDRVRATWDPNDAWRREDPGYRELERQQYVTIVDFALRADGMIDQLEITRPSGSEALDREAVRALDEVVPVRNVPEALLEQDGRAYIRYYFNFDARRGSRSMRWLRR